MTKKDMIQYIDSMAADLSAASDSIWDKPEIAFDEYHSSEVISGLLEKKGFHVEKGICGLPTAFRATYGSGKPVLGILGEYDALDGMSQAAGVVEKKVIEGQQLGHGCCHHALGIGSAGAALGVKKYLEENSGKGTIVYFGCPAEEGGSGKCYMVRDGLFDAVDCVLTWHPSDLTGLFTGKCLSVIHAVFHFHGKSAHAAEFPYMGRSALDAVELMDVGVNYLREHMLPNARVHYAIVDTGGEAANVVQSHAAVLYSVRAPETWQAKALYARVKAIAAGAAMMTETVLEIDGEGGMNSLVPNEVMDDVLFKNMQEIPLPDYDEADYEMAKRYRSTIDDTRATFAEILEQMSRKEQKEVMPYQDSDIFHFIIPKLSREPVLFGSTDVGDVSNVCPVGQIHVSTYAAGTPLHSWQAVSQGKLPLMHKGILYASKVLAGAAVDLFEQPDQIQMAREELVERTKDHPYESLLDMGKD